MPSVEEAISPGPFQGRPDVCLQLGDMVIALCLNFYFEVHLTHCFMNSWIPGAKFS